jgi:hypothetical protein
MKIKPEYEEVEEFNTMALKIIEHFTEVFVGIDPQSFMDRIKCVAITNKERPDGNCHYDVKGVSYPIRMFCECEYVVTIYMSDWAILDDNLKDRLIFAILRRIPLDDEPDGKVLSQDFKDDGLLVRTFGADYMESDDGVSIFDDNFRWIV